MGSRPPDWLGASSMRIRAQLPLVLVLKRRRKAERRARSQQQNAERRRRSDRRRLARMADGGSLPDVPLKAPEYFALLKVKSHDAMVKFLHKLVALTLSDERVVCIDFRPTKRFHSDGTLLFYAELQRILQRRPRSVKCILPSDAVARQVLSRLGILSQLGYHKKFPSNRDDVLHWDVQSGVQADATQGLGQAIEALPRLPKPQIGKLFRSVTEALTNVTQHAYSEPRQDGTGTSSDRGWWMFVKQEPRDLTVMFCDLGLGVPYTVPRRNGNVGWFAHRMAAVLGAVGVRSHQDGETIQVTVDEKRSRLQQEHRGNGFGNMLETISAAGAGRLIIYSNRGAYSYQLNNGKESSQARNYSGSIFGTVIGWHISLTEEQA